GQLVASAGEVAQHQGEASDQAADEAAPGLVVPGHQQEQREHHHQGEGDAGDDLEDHHAPFGSQGQARRQPGAPSVAAGDVIGPGVEVQHVLRQVGGGPAVPDGDTLVQVTHAGYALFATGDEDQGGHARGDHQQHRDLPEGVPDTGVAQGHVDHVVAAADLVG